MKVEIRLLQQHVEHGLQNDQYSSTFSAVMLKDTNTWLDRKLMENLTSSSYFSVSANECVDISSTEELLICCQGIVNGKLEEHYITVLHFNATTISDISASYYSPRT